MPDLYQVTSVRLIDGCPNLLDVEANSCKLIIYVTGRLICVTARMITNCRTLLGYRVSRLIRVDHQKYCYTMTCSMLLNIPHHSVWRYKSALLPPQHLYCSLPIADIKHHKQIHGMVLKNRLTGSTLVL